MVLPNPLILISPSPQVIKIKNDGKSSIQVSISNATLTIGSTLFYEVPPGVIKEWQRAGTEVVFINGGGFGRIVVAAAGPGTYIVPESQYTDPNVSYVFNSDPGRIVVKNNLDTIIKVKVTTNTGDAWPGFFDIPPGGSDFWTRTGLETVFVKYSSSDVLFTYLGIPGQNLQIDRRSSSGAPIFSSVQNLTSTHINVDVFEASSNIIAKISTATNPNGSERFYGRAPGGDSAWARNGPEVVYVNGPAGTAVGSYYGKNGFTLEVNSPISIVCNCQHQAG